MCPLFRGSTVHKEVDKVAGPTLFRGSTVHKEEDSLSIVDKVAGPNVSFILRLCTVELDILFSPSSLTTVEQVPPITKEVVVFPRRMEEEMVVLVAWGDKEVGPRVATVQVAGEVGVPFKAAMSPKDNLTAPRASEEEVVSGYRSS